MCCLFNEGNKFCGNIHINGEEVEDSKQKVHIQMYATNLDKKDLLGKVCNNQIHTSDTLLTDIQ